MAQVIAGREKRYVTVDVRFDPEGRLRPLAIRFGPGQVYTIDKIKDVSRRAAQVQSDSGNNALVAVPPIPEEACLTTGLLQYFSRVQQFCL